jgi:uncharacterized protein YyaL (SSP411 family)
MEPGALRLRQNVTAVLITLFALVDGCKSAAPAAAVPASQPAVKIEWHKWSDDQFAQAKAQHKFVLLDLEAVWCHWCHVQDEITYRDPQVIALINVHYIPVKVDQDSRPDISNRYEDYGWPATVVFNGDGAEIVKRSGYLPPKEMSSMLQAIVDDPTPGPSIHAAPVLSFINSSLSADTRNELEGKVVEGYDGKLGGWGHIHKYVDWDRMEFEMMRFRGGDKMAGERAEQTLTAGLKLIDPVWGGVYQYSIEGDWDHPHFEKLIQFQGQMMRIYALGYLVFNDPAYLKAANDIRRYLDDFLRDDDGAYFVSQDADLVDGTYAEKYFALDDAGRRKLGVPRVDRHQYSRENGWAIEGLTALYEAGGDAAALSHAKDAANWIIADRSLGAGGFCHGEHDAAGPYLGDTLFMGQAFLDLYTASADRAWLGRASAAADFIAEHFGPSDMPGFPTAASAGAAGYAPQPDVDENVTAVRFFNLLANYTGKHEYGVMAQRAMRYLAAIAAVRRSSAAGILLADQELGSPPLHVTIVGSKSAPAAAALFATALRSPTDFKRVEWWDPAQGPLPNADVDYPQFGFPVAFLCSGNACSSPLRAPAALAAKLGAARPGTEENAKAR